MTRLMFFMALSSSLKRAHAFSKQAVSITKKKEIELAEGERIIGVKTRVVFPSNASYGWQWNWNFVIGKME